VVSLQILYDTSDGTTEQIAYGSDGVALVRVTDGLGTAPQYALLDAQGSLRRLTDARSGIGSSTHYDAGARWAVASAPRASCWMHSAAPLHLRCEQAAYQINSSDGNAC
jgi:hypothetical protein